LLEATIHWVQFGAGNLKYPNFQKEFLKISVERYQIKLIVYEPVNEVIEKWIN
jgi:hypothetical protein